MYSGICALVFLVLGTSSTPIIIRSGVGKLEDHGGGESGKVYAAHTNTGLTNFDGGVGFDKDNQRKFATAADSGKFGEQDQKKVEKVDEGAFGGQKFHKVGGGTVADFDQKTGHNKGHHKSGFHNTYHKDESGSNSSFFDEADDHGGQSNRGSKKNAYGDAATRRNNGHYLNGNSYNKDNAHRGAFTNGDRYEKDHGDRRNFNRERFYDDRKQAGRNNAASHYGGGGRKFAEEVHTPQYFQPYDAPIAPVAPIPYGPQAYPHKITVYEDPRLGQGGGGGGGNRFQDYDRYYDDSLDVRPPTAHPYYEERYYDGRRPNYDYYY